MAAQIDAGVLLFAAQRWDTEKRRFSFPFLNEKRRFLGNSMEYARTCYKNHE